MWVQIQAVKGCPRCLPNVCFGQVLGLLPVQKDILKSSRIEELLKTKLVSHPMKGIRQAAGKYAWITCALWLCFNFLPISSFSNPVSKAAFCKCKSCHEQCFTCLLNFSWPWNGLALCTAHEKSRNAIRKPYLFAAERLSTKWGIEYSVQDSPQAAAAVKAAPAKPAKEEYDEQYQQELEILRQERAEVSRFSHPIRAWRHIALLPDIFPYMGDNINNDAAVLLAANISYAV